jgi:hypothetical protein
LGVTPQKRLRKSLFEMYKRGNKDDWTNPRLTDDRTTVWSGGSRSLQIAKT